MGDNHQCSFLDIQINALEILVEIDSLGFNNVGESFENVSERDEQVNDDGGVEAGMVQQLDE